MKNGNKLNFMELKIRHFIGIKNKINEIEIDKKYNKNHKKIWIKKEKN